MKCRLAVLGAAGVVCLFIVVTPAAGGWIYDMRQPANSPFWWTLTDDLTPEELKSTLSDRAACLERYQAAVEVGLEGPLPQEKLEELSFYYHRRQTPELMPMWHAFSMWATRLEPGRSSWTEERAKNELYKYDISEGGAEQLIVYAAKYRAEEHALGDKLMHDQQGFVDLQHDYLYPHGVEGVEQPSRARRATLEKAIYQKDYAFFARLSGKSEERIEEMMSAWRTSPRGQAASPNLPLMKADLSSEDWENFRRFLLKERAARMGSLIEFSTFLGVEK